MKTLFNNKIILVLTLLFLQATAFAQGGEQFPPVEMADKLYQSGKIYVVVVSLAVIFVGIVVYLVTLDRKISKLEEKLKNN
ncbi:MAG TPA: CcmD family protein [Bacteroidia bacterium]|jgi:CcmD family protein|nr:CcmD family protein [Bacteroidia bacterium]